MKLSRRSLLSSLLASLACGSTTEKATTMKIIRVVEAATGAPINVLVPEGQEGIPGPVNRANQGDDITLEDGALVFTSTARGIGAATADPVDVDVTLTFQFSATTEVSESPDPAVLFAEVIDQDGGDIGMIYRVQEYTIVDTAPLQPRSVSLRFVGRIPGTGTIRARFTLGNGGDTTAVLGITGAVMAWVVRPILGNIFALT
jgi:hypothetical protein